MLLEGLYRGTSLASGGLGFIAGQSPALVTVAGAPARRPVYVLERAGLRVVASGYSGNDGTYMFEGLSPNRSFVVVAFDDQGQFNAVIRDRVIPAPMT